MCTRRREPTDLDLRPERQPCRRRDVIASSDIAVGVGGAVDEPRSIAVSCPSAPAMDHDANALAVVERFLDGEGVSLPNPGNVPLEPRIVDGVKVFELTIDEVDHQIDAQKDPIAGLGFNGLGPARV